MTKKKRQFLIILILASVAAIGWLVINNWHIITVFLKKGNVADQVVLDPESGQYVIFNELTILASGEDVEAIVAEFNGEIVSHIQETDTYQVRFPVKDLDELRQIRTALESKGLTAYYSVVIIP
jgi:hypothetical protein